MMKRVEQQQVDAMIEDSKEIAPSSAAAGAAAPAPADGPEALAKEPLAAECTFDDFAKVDMRVARVVEAEEVKEADKLLRLTLSLGGDVRKNVFAGIKGVYKPEDLLGKLVICCGISPREKCGSALARAWCWRRGPGERKSSSSRPTRGPCQASACISSGLQF